MEVLMWAQNGFMDSKFGCRDQFDDWDRSQSEKQWVERIKNETTLDMWK